jgi:phospholipid/cholesterol/gamma-HCH transport system ATP-binding protein
MTTPAIALKDVRKVLGGRPVLDGLTLELQAGETLVLLGPSGSGKSVLLKHVVGLMTPDAGTVRVCGTDLARADRAALLAIRAKIGYLFQGAALLNSLTVFDNVALPVRERDGLDDEALRREVRDRLALVGLADAEGKMPAELSGGMRKRAGLARAIMGRPRVLLYDEPTAGLDPPGAAGIGGLIRDLQEKMGVTSLVVTHDMDLAFRVADRLALLNQGRIHLVGTREAFEASDDPVVRDFVLATSTR